MGLDTEELKVSSNYTISEYLSCHRTATFAGNGNFYEKPAVKALAGVLTRNHPFPILSSAQYAKDANPGKVGILFHSPWARKVTA